MFRVPSSDPPSTPDSRRASHNIPSTTPAGPPPERSIIASSTPAGPPPTSTLFGSSRPNFQRPSSYSFNYSTLGSSPPKNGVLEGVGSGSIGTSTLGRPGSQRGRTGSGFRVSNSSPGQYGHRQVTESSEDEDDEQEDEDEDMGDSNHEEESGDEEEDEDAEGDEDADEEMGDEESEEDEQIRTFARPRPQNPLSQSVASQNSVNEPLSGPVLVKAGTKQSQYDLVSLAKGLSPGSDRFALHEPDEVILQSERLLQRLQESDVPEKRGDVLADVAHELLVLWQTSSASESRGALASSRSGSAAALSNASGLASLLLNIHHPACVKQSPSASGPSLALTRLGSSHFTPIPKALLDWLNTYRYDEADVDAVLRESRGYSRHPNFWDAVHVSAFRGQFAKTLKLLKGANFAVAETAQADGLQGAGYAGPHLVHANNAAEAAVELLQACPAVLTGDWDIKGQDWNIYRQQIHQVCSDLREYAEGDSQNRQSVSQPFNASHFGLSQSQASFHLSVTSRRAESKVPWSVYQNLSKLYQLLLGNEEEIISLSLDWIESVLGLAIWWDGAEDDAAQGSLAASRRSVARSQRIRTVDVTPVKAYCQRLSSAFAAVLENNDEGFSLNTTDRFEVGVACIIDDNVEATLQILRGLSLTVASAVTEIACIGEWFTPASGLLNQFDQSDLMVLSYTEQPRGGLSKDDVLVTYARLLTSKDQLTSEDGKTTREGWELAIQILGRLDDSVLANGKIEQILDNLPLQSADRVDRITQLCHSMGLSQHALDVSLRFADHLRANTQNHGDTLLYYARAHAGAKIQEVLRVLVAHCLVKSISYPPYDELDASLNSLITSPKKTLTKLSSLDPEAAQLLSNHLSGYATIRRFYDLRDEEVSLKAGEQPVHRPMARRRATANALMVVISSASSSIRGGLYDPEVENVVQVDVLLPLFGEALVFVNQPKRTLTLRHLYTLLAAVEDLCTAPAMIRTQCEEVLATTLAAAHDPSNASHPSLAKSTSNLTTASSQFSLIGSTDFGSVEGQSTESSAVLVRGGNVDDAKRGWDWRKGFPKGAKGEDVIRLLRLGIANELARSFAEGEVNP